METAISHHSEISSHPLTPARWADLEQLFGKHGAYGGCWCMWWRSKRKEFEARGGDGNRKALKDIVESGEVPGILLYVDGVPAGWCSVAPREQYGSLNRSPVLKPIDDQPVWSIVCFFIAKPFKNRGLSRRLIRCAIDYVSSRGGKIIEAYPTRPKKGRLPPVSVFMGLPALFEREGFVEVAQPSQSKIIMRYFLD